MVGLTGEAKTSRTLGSRNWRPRSPAPHPLLGPALALAVGIWASETVGPVSSAGKPIVLISPLLLLFGTFLLRRTRTARLLLWLAAGGVGFARHQAANVIPADHVLHLLENEPILTRLQGVVLTTPVLRAGERRNPFLPYEPPDRCEFLLSAEALHVADPPSPLSGRIRVRVTGAPTLHPGDRVELTGRLYPLPRPRNPGDFDWRQWGRRQGIDAGLSVPGPEHVHRLGKQETCWRRSLVTLRQAARRLLLEPYAEVGSEAGKHLLDAMVLGQRTAVDRRLNEAFLRAGGMHFLAVSGFHVGVLATAAWALVRLFTRRRRLAACATLGVIVIYALVTEPRAPILRAAVLAGLACLAFLARRPMCPLNFLSSAALLLLAWNPLALFQPGFQLSFVQVAGLILWVPGLYRRLARTGTDGPPREAASLPALAWRRLGQWVGGLGLVCLVAWLWALPLVWLHFGRWAPWGWLGTFVLSLPVSACIWLGFLTLLANLLCPPAAPPLATALAGATRGVLRLAEQCGRLPGSLLEVTPPPPLLVLGVYLAWLAYALYSRHAHANPLEARSALEAARRHQRQRRTRLALLVLAAGVYAVCAGWSLGGLRENETGCTLHVLAVGDGNAVTLTCEDGTAAVFDAGTNRNFDVGAIAAAALRRAGAERIDTVFVSHANFDHYSGVPGLLARMPADRLVSNPYFTHAEDKARLVDRFFTLLPAEPAHEERAAGDTLTLGPARVEILWPPRGLDPAKWPANDRSFVLRLHAFGRTVLLTGDIGERAMRTLLQADAKGELRLSADVLVAPHHGSVTPAVTDTFFTAVDPLVVVASTGRSKPALKELVRRTLGDDRQVLVTEEVGAIRIRLGPDGVLTTDTPYAP